ncbi:MAG: ASCH domain-containing protein [Paenibacillaceae bacterium]|uniref:ASCH domain-containing protein n=1 Tax=Paenibacillus mellifer TaxID=2937794 RepID=A0A9X1XVM5_9BACL|nr:ASCH domain-containing protein [Paenibacillus mellifer]MBW4837890.1 ASCH domain-containing protein [Paenibacillaceae bacterium]MCK8485803.1 ASCH domain-containing protein [Paenibacillus mellifer]
MRCITIRQPWATLIAIGAKRLETRSWRTNYRGELGIHAGKQIDRKACETEPIRSLLLAHGYSSADQLPRGAIVAVCRLNDCFCVRSNSGETAWLGVGERCLEAAGQEYRFGDFAPGRYAWELTELRPLPEPIPALGKQGLWSWESYTLISKFFPSVG